MCEHSDISLNDAAAHCKEFLLFSSKGGRTVGVGRKICMSIDVSALKSNKFTKQCCFSVSCVNKAQGPFSLLFFTHSERRKQQQPSDRRGARVGNELLYV